MFIAFLRSKSVKLYGEGLKAAVMSGIVWTAIESKIFRHNIDPLYGYTISFIAKDCW